MKIIQTSNRREIRETLPETNSGDIAIPLQLRVARTAPGTVKESARTIEFILSDETRDHEGDIIRQAGWDLAVFARNPVLPWCHNYDEPPLGDWQDVRIAGTQLQGVAKFAAAEDYPFADTIFRLAARGILRAVSVGFRPKRWNSMRDEEQGFMGYEFLEQTLLECSACTVPCNPNALARAVGDKVISRRELADIVSRQVLAQMSLTPAERASVTPELLSRLDAVEATIETLKALLPGNADAGGKPATSQAPASAEVARLLELIAEIKTTASGN